MTMFSFRCTGAIDSDVHGREIAAIVACSAEPAILRPKARRHLLEQWLASRFCDPQTSHFITCWITVPSNRKPNSRAIGLYRYDPHSFFCAAGDRFANTPLACTRIAIRQGTNNLIVMNDQMRGIESGGGPAPKGRRAIAAMAAGQSRGSGTPACSRFRGRQSRYRLLSLWR